MLFYPEEVATTEVFSLPETEKEHALRTENISTINLLEGAYSNKVLVIGLQNGTKAIFKPKNGEEPILSGESIEGTYYLRERAAYVIDRFLGFELVPPTVIREIDGHIGSMQEFITGTKNAVEVGDRKTMEETLKGEFIKLWLLDYIINNPDRGDNNFLVNMEERKLYAIDNGCSFSKHMPMFFGNILYEQIPEEIANTIHEIATSKKQRELLAESLGDLLKPEETALCIQRIERLHTILSRDGKITSENIRELVPSYISV